MTKLISPLPHTLSFSESIQGLSRQKCKPEEQGRQTSNDKAKPRKHQEQPQRHGAMNSSATPLQTERHTQEKLLLENGQRELHNDAVESTADVWAQSVRSGSRMFPSAAFKKLPFIPTVLKPLIPISVWSRTFTRTLLRLKTILKSYIYLILSDRCFTNTWFWIFTLTLTWT